MPPNRRNSITNLIENASHRLNNAVLRSLPKSDFDANAIPAQQASRFRLWSNNACFHPSWDTLDGARRSAACRYEWARLLIFLSVEVLPLLQHAETTFYHVTLADKRWRISPSEASAKTFSAPRRKVRAALQALRKAGYKPIFVIAYEMSGDRNLNRPGFAGDPNS